MFLSTKFLLGVTTSESIFVVLRFTSIHFFYLLCFKFVCVYFFSSALPPRAGFTLNFQYFHFHRLFVEFEGTTIVVRVSRAIWWIFFVYVRMSPYTRNRAFFLCILSSTKPSLTPCYIVISPWKKSSCMLLYFIVYFYSLYSACSFDLFFSLVFHFSPPFLPHLPPGELLENNWIRQGQN